MSFTIKGALTTKKNKNGLYPLTIRYTIGGVPYNISLKASDGKVIAVDKNDFDTASGLMKGTKSNYYLLNKLILTHCEILEDVAKASNDKSFQIVKALYLKRLKEKEAEEAKQEAIDKREGTVVKARKLHSIFSAEEAVEKKQVLTKSLSEINRELEQYKAEGVIVELDEEEVEFKKHLLEFPKKYAGRASFGQYKSWASNILEFGQQTNTPLLFSQLDHEFESKYRTYLMFNRKAGKTNMVNNTYGGQVKKLIQFVDWCLKTKRTKTVNLSYKDFTVFRKPKSNIIYLEDTELDLLYNEYRSQVTDAKKRLIDLTIFQSCTGLRYGDIYASKWMVAEVDGEKVLTGETEKNEGTFVIPFSLDSRIEEILLRYSNKMSFTVKNDYNRDIKILLKNFFKHYGLHQEPLPYTKERFDTIETITDYKHNLFSSHCNRRRFINHWKLKGFEDQTILDMIGSKDSEVLQDYKKKDVKTKTKVITTKLNQLRMLEGIKESSKKI